VQIGLSEFENCCAWQPAHGAWSDRPGSCGRGELLSRRWQRRQGKRPWFLLLCRNFE